MTIDGHRTAERRSIELHRLVADRLDDQLIDTTRDRVRGWLATPGPVHRDYAQRWLELLDGPRDDLIAALTRDTPEMRVLRQSSPFAGALSDEQRVSVLHSIH
ncbi:MAG: hypothetical protein ACLP50_16980 [Solirubrobacteraceae bacterium]